MGFLLLIEDKVFLGRCSKDRLQSVTIISRFLIIKAKSKQINYKIQTLKHTNEEVRYIITVTRSLNIRRACQWRSCQIKTRLNEKEDNGSNRCPRWIRQHHVSDIWFSNLFILVQTGGIKCTRRWRRTTILTLLMMKVKLLLLIINKPIKSL